MEMRLPSAPDFGALVISLDFELSWGVTDLLPYNPAYKANIEGEQEAVRKILALFEEYGIAGTWATVGLIFAESAAEAGTYRPAVLPAYKNAGLSPFEQVFGENGDRELYFAPELIDQIRNTPRQEVATHTFSHYYCREAGQTAEAFAADMDSALAIAARRNIEFRSIVFPRNQHNPAYDRILADRGITCFRGNQRARMYQFDSETQTNRFLRALRLLDTYFNLSGLNTVDWGDLNSGMMINVPASIFLRPVRRSFGVMQDLQLRRIERSMADAARNGRIFHLWWHPHNFGTNREQNLSFLRRVLDAFKRLENQYGIRSLTMSDTAEIAAGTIKANTRSRG